MVANEAAGERHKKTIYGYSYMSLRLHFHRLQAPGYVCLSATLSSLAVPGRLTMESGRGSSNSTYIALYSGWQDSLTQAGRQHSFISLCVIFPHVHVHAM